MVVVPLSTSWLAALFCAIFSVSLKLGCTQFPLLGSSKIKSSRGIY
jgi:hypothetical protein